MSSKKEEDGYETPDNDEELVEKYEKKNKNKGTGAGGANTNKNGKKLENITRDIISKNTKNIGISFDYDSESKRKWKVENIEYNGENYIRAPESSFKLFENIDNGGKQNIPKAEGAKQPDELIVNKKTNTINFLECKVQNGSGSKAEVLQSFNEKILNLKKRFPNWNINYVYVLSSYFKKFKWELLRLDEEKILYVFEDDLNFENKILEYSFK